MDVKFDILSCEDFKLYRKMSEQQLLHLCLSNLNWNLASIMQKVIMILKNINSDFY